jgi:hypothetical protein
MKTVFFKNMNPMSPDQENNESDFLSWWGRIIFGYYRVMVWWSLQKDEMSKLWNRQTTVR